MSISTGQLTAEQKHKIHHLMNAQWAIEKASQHIIDALGDSDVTQEYIKRLALTIEDLTDDMEDAHANS